MRNRKSLLLLAGVTLPMAGCCVYYVVGAVVHGRSLEYAYAQLAPGMTSDQVRQVMGRDVPSRYDGPLRTRALTPDEARRCDYTLVYSNPYYLDPSIYCYFASDDRLINADLFD